MPLVGGHLFDLQILVLQKEYLLMVNGNQCYNFPQWTRAKIWADDAVVERCLPDLSVYLLERDVIRLPIVKKIPPSDHVMSRAH